jgi:hypothetical protein
MAKSALMQELFDGVKGRVPTEVYRTFRQTGEPPADCRVFIGRYADNGKLPSNPTLIDAVTGEASNESAGAASDAVGGHNTQPNPGIPGSPVLASTHFQQVRKCRGSAWTRHTNLATFRSPSPLAPRTIIHGPECVPSRYLEAHPGRSLDQRQRLFASRRGEFQHAFEFVRDAVHRRGAQPRWLPRIQDEVCGARRGQRRRIRVSSMSELAPTTTETWTEVDRSADPHIELERLPPAMRHLMPVVPDPVDDALIAVQVAWNTPPSPRIRAALQARPARSCSGRAGNDRAAAPALSGTTAPHRTKQQHKNDHDDQHPQPSRHGGLLGRRRSSSR